MTDEKRAQLAEYARILYWAFPRKKQRANARWRLKNPEYSALWKAENKEKCRFYTKQFHRRHPEVRRHYRRINDRRQVAELRRGYLLETAQGYFKRAGLPSLKIPDSFLVEWIKPKLEIERYIRKQAEKQTNENNTKHKSTKGTDHVRSTNHEMLKAAQ